MAQKQEIDIGLFERLDDFSEIIQEFFLSPSKLVPGLWIFLPLACTASTSTCSLLQLHAPTTA